MYFCLFLLLLKCMCYIYVCVVRWYAAPSPNYRVCVAEIKYETLSSVTFPCLLESLSRIIYLSQNEAENIPWSIRDTALYTSELHHLFIANATENPCVSYRKITKYRFRAFKSSLVRIAKCSVHK